MIPEPDMRFYSGYLPLLGVCPLLPPSLSLLTGLSIGLLVFCSLVFCSLSVSLFRYIIPYERSVAVILLISASVVTLLDLIMQAYFYELHQSLDIYLPLLAMNALILFYLQRGAQRSKLSTSMKGAIQTATSVCLFVFLTGTIRELLGKGGVLLDSHELINIDLSIVVLPFSSMSLLLEAPGAFIIFALLIAGSSVFKSGKIRLRPEPVSTEE